MKIIDLIDRIRYQLSDVMQPNLWSDEELLSYINTVHTELFKLLSFDTLVFNNIPYTLKIFTITDLMSDFEQIYENDPQLLSTLINGVISVAYTKDDVDTYNIDKSMAYKRLFLDGIELYKRGLLKKRRSSVNINNGFL